MTPPPPRGTPYRVAFCCLGNICRSPMADVVMTDRIDTLGLAGRVEVTSCGTGSWHVGEPMHPLAAATLASAGYDPSRHRARQLKACWLGRDLLLAMDAANLADIRRLAIGSGRPTEPGRLRLFRGFDPDVAVGVEADLDDPYGGDSAEFAATLAIVERTCTHLAEDLATLLTDTSQ